LVAAGELGKAATALEESGAMEVSSDTIQKLRELYSYDPNFSVSPQMSQEQKWS